MGAPLNRRVFVISLFRYYNRIPVQSYHQSRQVNDLKSIIRL